MPSSRTSALEGRVGGAVLAVTRRSTSLTQEALAERLGASIATVQGWEQGRKPLANVPFTRLHALRTELQAAGADPGMLGMLDRALNADLMLAALDCAGNPGRHPLALAVPDRATTELLAWPLSGRPPRQFDRQAAIIVGHSERSAVTESLRDLAERAGTDGQKPFMIRRQVTFLLAQAGDTPAGREWTADSALGSRYSDLHEWTPRWPLARSAAVAAAQTGDLAPLHAFIAQGLGGDTLISANLNYWAYWVGEYPAAWASDSEMTSADGDWSGTRLLGSLLVGLVSAPYRDLCAHTLWALLLHRRHLAVSRQWQSRIRSAVSQALGEDRLESSARRRAEEIEYLVRS